VGLGLAEGEAGAVHRRVCEILQKRASKQPITAQSAGCVFKRPEGDYAGRLVEAVSGKGLCVGGAMVSPKHAHFIINCGGARARDVLELIRVVQSRVREEFDVDLETEVCLLGEGF
jgi:UDP-N-acetylmuramate dehydrogenase